MHYNNRTKLSRYLFLVVPMICIFAKVKSQPSSLSINLCYKLAKANYPLIKQRNLISKTKEYTVSNSAKGCLPVFSINGQATYQSTVTSFPFSIPIPGFKLPVYNKDQYKIFGELDQTIFDGGIIKNQKQTAEASETIQQQSLEVELYALYDRVNQLYFGTLLLTEQIKQNDLLKKDVQSGIDKERALLANGTAFRSNVDELEAQLLQADQARIELMTNKKAYMDMLGVFINTKVDENTILEKPVAPEIIEKVNRPELLNYDSQKKIYQLQDKLLVAQLLPKLSLFAQGGYARPGLNPLSNNFAWYYIGGLKISWNLGGLYTLKNQQQLLNINQQNLDIQKEIFLFNNSLTQKQQNSDIQKYSELIKQDNAIINLRESVKKASLAQLQNGVISAHEYITEVDAEDQARQNQILHEIQLLQSQFSFQNTMGNITNQ